MGQSRGKKSVESVVVVFLHLHFRAFQGSYTIRLDSLDSINIYYGRGRERVEEVF
jgi:hypothetical protein